MVDQRSDPNALRFLIGRELRDARTRANATQAEAAKQLGCTQSKINFLESGKSQQQPEDVTTLLRFYGAELAHVERIASLAARADQNTWWAEHSEVLPNWFKTFVGLEGVATAQFTYTSMHLPGQLQTAAYAAALLQGHLRVPPVDVPQVVQARMARQRLTGDNPLQLRVVIEEYVLDRIAGGPAVMREQLKHLLTLARLPNVELHVMPVAVAVHDGIDGDFIVLDFDDAQSIGYIEYPAGGLYVQDRDGVALYKMAADRLCAAALSESESVDAIKRRLADLKN